MATMITSDCINCGACEPECPNTAIYQGGVEWDLNGVKHPPIADGIFYIVPEKCTECVGFYDHEACAAVCPVDCCIPNPDIVESEAVLIDRAKQLHPDVAFADNFPSRFRKEGVTTPTPAAPVQPNGPAESVPVTVAAPAPTPKLAAPAPAPRVTAPAAPAAKLAVVVRPISAPPPKPTATKAQVEKVFPGELAGTFEQALARIQPKQVNPLLGTLLSIAQPILGALPSSTKRTLEQAVGNHRYFDAAAATGLNILFNMILYPAVLLVVYAQSGGEVFGQGVNKWVFLGLVIASAETIIRLRESFFQGVPTEEAKLGGTWYGFLPLAPLVSPLVGVFGSRSQDKGQIPFDGYYSQEFDEKTERARRYGEMYTVEERGNAYLLRLEFPRRVPLSAAKR